jgi:hypothetical protein
MELLIIGYWALIIGYRLGIGHYWLLGMIGHWLSHWPFPGRRAWCVLAFGF